MKNNLQFFILCLSVLLGVIISTLVIDDITRPSQEVYEKLSGEIKRARSAEQRWKEIAHERHADAVECHTALEEWKNLTLQCAAFMEGY